MTNAPPVGINLGSPPPEGFEFFARVEDPGSQMATLFRLTDWTESWLIAMMILHITLLALNLKFRRNGLVQGTLFGILLLLVYFSENINQWAAENWKKFANRQYFDSSGLFISVIFSIPALFNCMIIVGNWLYQSSLLMVQVKQAQLRQQLRNADKTNTASVDEDVGDDCDDKLGSLAAEMTKGSPPMTRRRAKLASGASRTH